MPWPTMLCINPADYAYLAGCGKQNQDLHGPRICYWRRIEDGLLHTTCGSPNYVAPEILANKGNLAVLYQKILKGEVQIPTWLSPGAKNLIKMILDPNPVTRITMTGIKSDEWFKQDYSPANPDDEEEDINVDDEAFSINELPSEGERSPDARHSHTQINAFQLIGMSSCLDLSGFFEKEDVSERKIRFTSNHSEKDLLEKIEEIVLEMGYCVQKKNGRLKVMQEHKGREVWVVYQLQQRCLR
ncbi:CBL-interacting serine/threonine-protein kinase [Prunus yedoensis var. nudiflora]|uniref:non-specific serine/threonine protein kinase n=1 Tax=Prunus yedoensis var. nudiflora TaxID=2094558 RepID=A0A314Y4A5_PRUYE|nr:CBL-interacting serine/threonine-protein kinase [Prunus yedoensis var. nudiflora]